METLLFNLLFSLLYFGRNGSLFCLNSITWGSYTALTLYNDFDVTVDGINTYRFICLVASRQSNGSLLVSQSPGSCNKDQTPTSQPKNVFDEVDGLNIKLYPKRFSSREAGISEDVTSDNTPENITERARPTQHDSDQESLDNEDETDSIQATPPSSKKYKYRYAYNGLSEYRNRKRKENINEDHENKDDKITDIDRTEIGLKTYGKRRMYWAESKQKDVLVSPSTIDDLESPVAKTVKSSSHIESSTKTSQDFTISTYPDDISAGDWILIKSPVDAEEKWIGEVTSVKRKINFYWVFNNNEVWVGGGVMRPKSGTCSKTDILAKFVYDFRHKMPTALKEKLDNLLSS